MMGLALRRSLEHADTLARLWRHPKAGREALRAFQRRKLRFLVLHAWRAVPYYRELFDAAGIRPESVRDVSDLARLPITTKEDLRFRPLAETIASGVDAAKLIDVFTSGSTGEPMHIRRSTLEDYVQNAFRLRMLQNFGVRARERSVRLAAPGTVGDRHAVSIKPVKDALGIHRTKPINTANDPRHIARKIAEVEPDILRGGPATIAEVGAVWSEVAPNARKPRLVLSGGSPLTHSARRCIESTLGAQVRDTYAAYEFNLIAWECVQTGRLHVCDDSVVVEILRDGRPVAPGESGDVVVTGLHGHCSPYIRYALGDVATRGPDGCECGAPFSAIEQVHGRVLDYCVLPSGERKHLWKLLPESFWDAEWYKRYQLYQTSASNFVLRIVPHGDPPAEAVAAIERAGREEVGPGCEFRIEFVAAIPLEASGKQKLCRSEIGAATAAEHRYTAR